MKHTIALFFLLLLCSCGTTEPDLRQMPNLSETTITDIHDAYRAGHYTVVDLTAAYLARMDSLNAPLNAISYRNPEALAEARRLDEELVATGQLRPLHGIPLLVKDNINTAGLPTTAGALALKDFVAEDDAFIIKQLREAGAIIIAKTNMAEWAFSAMHTESSTFGTTRNPYNLAHVPAGSSGGTAAAVASNFATIGLGTDTGNSIRGPSSHNALVGFRTTLGLISREGIVPLYLRNDVVGPMCRTVADATRVMQAMTGYDAADPITQRGVERTPPNYTDFLDADGLRGARIGILRELSEANVHPEVSALFQRALVDMEALGATIVDPVVIPDFAELRQGQWCETFRADLEEFLTTYVKNDTIATLQDVVRIGSNNDYARSNVAFSLTKEGRYGDLPEPCGDAYTDARRIAFREAIERTMDSLQLDAIVYPSWNPPPALIDSFATQYLGDNSQIICPHTGQPGFSVPMGYTTGNLPAGIQFLGRMFSEPTLVKLCYGYEQGTLHRREPE
jgi:Asp-tRNA(Asn)/Glu-tRNA(Gln) amidotransferase A subunit family amidase